MEVPARVAVRGHWTSGDSVAVTSKQGKEDDLGRRLCKRSSGPFFFFPLSPHLVQITLLFCSLRMPECPYFFF